MFRGISSFSRARVANFAFAVCLTLLCGSGAHGQGKGFPINDLRALKTHTGFSFTEARPSDLMIVDLWATWCAPCLDILKKYEVLLERPDLKAFKGKVQILAVSVDDDPKDAIEFFRTHKLSLPLVFDPDKTLPQKLNAQVLPVSYLIDGRGRILLKSKGEPSDKLFSAIKQHFQPKTDRVNP